MLSKHPHKLLVRVVCSSVQNVEETTPVTLIPLDAYYPYAVSLQATKTASIPETTVSLRLLALEIFRYIKFIFQVANALPG